MSDVVVKLWSQSLAGFSFVFLNELGARAACWHLHNSDLVQQVIMVTAPSQVLSAVHVLTAAPLLELRVPAHGMFDGQLQPMVAVCPEHLNIVTCRFRAIHLRLNFQILGNTTSGNCAWQQSWERHTSVPVLA